MKVKLSPWLSTMEWSLTGVKRHSALHMLN
jgi:hypothetical protein